MIDVCIPSSVLRVLQVILLKFITVCSTEIWFDRSGRAQLIVSCTISLARWSRHMEYTHSATRQAALSCANCALLTIMPPVEV